MRGDLLASTTCAAKQGEPGQPLKATLEALARAGLVTRHVICRTPPPSVIYRLTPSASDLFPVLSSLAQWHRTTSERRRRALANDLDRQYCGRQPAKKMGRPVRPVSLRPQQA